MNVEQFLECELAGETEVLGENPPQCHSDNHESHMNLCRIEPGLPRWEADDEFCGTTYFTVVRNVQTSQRNCVYGRHQDTSTQIKT
jgi:hypothetical protein